MKKSHLLEFEQRQLQRYKFLPNYWKKVGLILLATSFLGLLVLKIFTIEQESARFFFRNLLMVSFLLIAISKEKVEDELIQKIRAQAFAMAFVCGVLYAIIQPFVNFALVNLLFEGAALEDLGAFQVVVFMLLVQLGFFHLLKRVS